MGFYEWHPELNEAAYSEQQAVLAEMAEEPTGLDDHTADPGECPLYTGPLDADGNPVDVVEPHPNFRIIECGTVPVDEADALAVAEADAKADFDAGHPAVFFGPTVASLMDKPIDVNAKEYAMKPGIQETVDAVKAAVGDNDTVTVPLDKGALAGTNPTIYKVMTRLALARQGYAIELNFDANTATIINVGKAVTPKKAC